MGDQSPNQTVRDSVARAFLANKRKPKTLTIQPNAMAVDVIFDEINRTKAIGVRYIDLSKNNKLMTVHVNNEVIVSASTLNSPTILMQSGIGDADLLIKKFHFAKENIILNNSEVGKNYADGVFTNILWNVTDELIDSFTLCTPWNTTFGYDDESNVNQCMMAWNNYTQNGQSKSIFDTTGFNAGGFFKSPYSHDTLSNDIQITLQP